MLVFVEYMHSS